MSPRKIRWWEYIFLVFCKTKISVDIACSTEDYSVAVYYRRMFGKVYVVKMETIKSKL